MRRLPFFRAASGAALCLWPACGVAECRALGAVYELAASDTPAVVLRLAEAPFPGPAGGLLVELTRPATPLPPYLRLQPVPAMGHGGIRLFPAPDATDAGMPLPGESDDGVMPPPGLPVIGLVEGADGRLYPLPDGLPQPADPAPDAIVVAGLAAELWYATNGGDTPVAITDGVWYLSGCGR
ncbi:MAG: hypothetical protein KF887_19475 [Paracoccaceae bacterium]|nr:MAG: hypothetical protein KF887_19475 [Paracoccaceae bacterium]